MNPIKKNLPNFITCLNLISGIISIIFAFNATESSAGLSNWEWSILFIAVAAVADFADGFTARLLGAYSELGKQLDSLSDNVSFGVAPALLIFNLVRDYPLSPDWLPWVTLIIPACGAIRLAKFNIDSRQSESFIGIPIPANAIFWIGYASIIAPLAVGPSAPEESEALLLVADALIRPAFIIPAILIISWLMVSELKIFSLKFKSFKWKGNSRRWILLLSSIALLLCFGIPSLTLIIILYIILSF